MERLYFFKVSPAVFLRMPQIISPLGIKPELGRVAEQPRQTQRHDGRKGTAFTQKLIDRLARNAQRRSQARGRQLKVRHEIITENFTRMRRRYFSNSPIFYTHLYTSMVVNDLYIVGIAIPKTEADPPLVIDRDRVPALSIPLQIMQTIARRNPEIIKATRIINVFEPPESPLIRGRCLLLYFLPSGIPGFGPCKGAC